MNQEISQFWRLFQELRGPMEASEDFDEAIYDELLAALQEIDEGLFLELCLVEGSKELIVTADGQEELFPVADQVIAAAPVLPPWSFLALKPRIGFPLAARWNSVEIQIKDCGFELFRDEESGKFILNLLAAGFREDQSLDIHNALLRALDHGLGERYFAETISETDLELVDFETLSSKGQPLADLYELLQSL
jgi:hypothetical protein